MKTIRSFLIILMTGVVFLSACVAQPVKNGPSNTPQPDGSQAVTLDDQGKTITLAVGERFLLNLGEGYNWEVSLSDQAVVSRVVGITVIRGAQGVYQARQAGSVSLSATGDPQCRQSQPACAMPSLLFSVTIIVKWCHSDHFFYGGVQEDRWDKQ
jgi:hypothetical protein